MDVYGDPKITGKIGTDIQDSKCSWLIANVLEHATEEQCHMLLDNYGKKDTEKIVKIKQLYKQMNMLTKFEEYEEGVNTKMRKLIDDLKSKIPTEFITNLWKKIYKRKF